MSTLDTFADTGTLGPGLQELDTLYIEYEGGKPIYFVSDIHLGDGSHADVFQDKDAYFLEFLKEVSAKAQALVIVGDALDFEQAWYFSRIVRAHREVIASLTQLAEEMRVVYIYGNHDPDILLFQDLLKWELCQTVIVDERILVQHGYEFDSYVGQKFEESSFWARTVMLYERIFRTWIRLPLREYYTFSNRAVHYLFYWVNRLNELFEWIEDRFEINHLGQGLRDWAEFWTRGVMGDPMGLTRPVVRRLEADPNVDTIVCGHSHLPGVVPVGDNKAYVNLGSWSFGNSQYGIWNGKQFQLMDFISSRSIRDENYRPIFEGHADRTYREWFEDQYMGFLRFRSGEEALREGVRPRPWVLSNLERRKTPANPPDEEEST
ncbi:MAG TPA: hypothetical protein DIU15_18700 [Deltaproteobacteria bacterium]|nr:hypothetical protein [Deltaproteobacteria bacterium]HCP48075.1 hypothetical protein [Deltaproteobacteria bacterium]